MGTTPLFDMSQAKPISAPLFDMSKAQPIEAPEQPKSWWQKTKEFEAQHGKGMPGAGEGAGLAGGLAEWDKASGGEIIGGLRDLFGGDVAKGLHRIITGGGAALSPAAPIAAAAAPLATAIGVAGGAVGGRLGQAGATALGATPDQAALAGDVGSIAGGLAGGATPSLARSFGRPALARVGSAATAVGESLDPDVIGLISPRLAHGLRLAGKVGKVATKLGGEAAGAGEIPTPVTPEVDPYAAARKASEPTPEAASPAAQQAYAFRPSIERILPPEPTSADTSPTNLEKLLTEGTGGKALEKGVPLREQGKAPSLPEGFTPVKSSALKGYKYNADAKEFETVTTGGQHYIHGDVSPEQAAEFEAADSKGKAWGNLKSNATLVAKVVNGQRMAVKPLSAPTATPMDDILNQMLEQIKTGKTLKDLK